MNYYERKKAELRAEAIEHQISVSEQNLSWWDISAYTEDLYERAKKVGMVRELRKEGII